MDIRSLYSRRIKIYDCWSPIYNVWGKTWQERQLALYQNTNTIEPSCLKVVVLIAFPMFICTYTKYPVLFPGIGKSWQVYFLTRIIRQTNGHHSSINQDMFIYDYLSAGHFYFNRVALNEIYTGKTYRYKKCNILK